ncbi:uncharacterized protein [Epargyreus clarus]
MKMVSAIWFLSALACLIADVRTGPSQQKDVESQRCYQCPHANNATDCEHLEDLVQVTCSTELPHCATIAVSPDYKSLLTCAAATQTPCTLTRKAKDKYEMTCTCAGHLCNAPFTPELRNELLNFSYTNLPDNRTTGLTEVFINSTAFADTSATNLYETITQRIVTGVNTITPVQPVTSTMEPNFDNANAPRAEALKHEATVPPDDDEDENEGSGSFEDVKPQIPAAPAAPSSFLPANENKAIPVHVNLLAAIPFISLYIVA